MPTRKVVATLKKSLLTTKLPSLTAYNQLSEGMTLEGFIVKVMDAGVLVAFYNGVKVSVTYNRSLYVFAK